MVVLPPTLLDWDTMATFFPWGLLLLRWWRLLTLLVKFLTKTKSGEAALPWRPVLTSQDFHTGLVSLMLAW